MKPKRIIIAIVILLSVILTIVFISKKVPKYIMQDGMMLALTLNGNSITKFPERGKYSITVDCRETGNGKWLVDEWQLALEDITDNVKCNLSFTSNPKTLISEVESKATEVADAKALKIDATYDLFLTYNEYENIANNSAAPYAWNENDGVWTQTASATGTTSYFQFYPSEPGGYQVCYILPASASPNNTTQESNYMVINRDSAYSNDAWIYSNNNSGDVVAGCYNIGYLTPSNYIVIRGYYYDQNVSFYIKKSTDIESKDVGYRYVGKSPNNWIWFNGEKWRIIGSMPTTLSDGTEKNLVKIIRNDSLGGFVYDSAGTNIKWGSNSLYTLLTTKYYGKIDATGSKPCISYNMDGKTGYGLCNYEEIGISAESDDYYGRMIKDVYWDVGNVAVLMDKVLISTSYIRESEAKSTTTEKVGLMSASDYSFATSGINYDGVTWNQLGSYEKNNWLTGVSWQWTSTNCSDSGVAIEHNGYLHCYGYLDNGYVVKPAVYLDPSVYIISGDGTEGNPYQIGM